jgi:predicted metal-dependent enzyme (double-stranded beta helix superfamily)
VRAVGARDRARAGLDQPVRELFERIGPFVATTPPNLPGIAAALVALARDRDYVARWVAEIGDQSGARAINAPERGPRLSIVHRRWGEMGAIHDHATWVALAPIVGLETHRRYRIHHSGAGERLELLEELELAQSQSVTMLPPDDLHDHGHHEGRGDPACVLIMTGDDQLRYRRVEWDAVTGRTRALEPGQRGRWLATEPIPDR